jgi:chemotaxis protein MotB
MSKKQIIIIKKIKGHGGHHGGAWKVAYADFVTAMMSLFIVLWLLNSSEHVRKAVAGYFNDPLGHSTMNGAAAGGEDSNAPATKDNDNIEQLKDRVQKALMQAKDFKALSKQIEMTVTPEGLRIELLESKNGTFFDSGSANLNENGREILDMLAKQLAAVPNRLSIEGHTDSQPYSTSSTYGNWELSSDRANAARRILQETGVRPDQVSQVRGYADQRLRLPQNPLDPSNRRISLIVQYLESAPPVVPAGIAVSAPAPAAPAKAGVAPAEPASPAAAPAAGNPPPESKAPAATKPSPAKSPAQSVAGRWLDKLRPHKQN